MTPPERLLWSVLRRNSTGFKFRRQHSIGPYVADFYSRDAHLVVEIDGTTHFTDNGRAHDRRRDAYMRQLALDVLRVTSVEVETNLEGVWLGIQRECQLRTRAIADACWIQAGSLVPGDRVLWFREFRQFDADEHDGVGRIQPDERPPLNPPASGGKEKIALRARNRSAPSPLAGRVGEGAIPLCGVELTHVDTEWTEEIVFHLEVEDSHSYVTEVCTIHNWG